MGVSRSLIIKADMLFRQDRLIAWGAPHWIACATCHHHFHPDIIEVGHIIGRGSYATRWWEENTGPQCRECNRNKLGNGLTFDQSVSADVVAAIEKAARDPRFRLTEEYVKQIIQKYEGAAESKVSTLLG